MQISARNGNHTFFEGEIDHLLPACDPYLTGQFQVIGKFIGHSAIHSGVGFIGLGEPAIQYIFRRDDIVDLLYDMEVRDIPGLASREAAEHVCVY